MSPCVQVCGTLAGGGEEEEEEFAILQGHADTLDESLRTVLHEIEQLREKWAESQAAIREQESRLGRLGGERDRLAGEIEALQERIAGLEQVLEQRDSTVCGGSSLTLHAACSGASMSAAPSLPLSPPPPSPPLPAGCKLPGHYQPAPA